MAKSNGISRNGMKRAKRNYCPSCKSYQNLNHSQSLCAAKIKLAAGLIREAAAELEAMEAAVTK